MSSDGREVANGTTFVVDRADATRLVFDTDGNAELYSIRLDGTGAMRLTADPADDARPPGRP